MDTGAASEALNDIMKLPPDKQSLPLLVLNTFDPLLTDLGYKSRHKFSPSGGPQYITYRGRSGKNTNYRIEIELYTNELNIKISRPPTAWRRIVQIIAYIFIPLVLILAIASIFTGNFPNFDLPSFSVWKVRSFRVKDIAIKTAGINLNNQYTDGGCLAVMQEHLAFFQSNLLPVIKGEQWIKGLGKEGLFG